MIEQINIEALWIKQIEAVRAAVNRHTEVAAPATNAFILQDDQAVGASVTIMGILQPIISVTRGTLQTIQILINDLCHRDYFASFIGMADQNYSITALAIRWVLMHEIAHWLLGHCGAAVQHSLSECTQHLVVFADEALEETYLLGNDERKCLELQADSLAFALLLHHAVFLDNSTEDLWSWIDDKQDSDSIDITIMVEKIRLIMLAAVCVILVIEQMRRKILDNTEMSSTYPLPLTRLTNLVAAAIRLSRYPSHR